MKDTKEIEHYLKSSSGIIYNDKGHTYFAKITDKPSNKDFISFYNIFGEHEKTQYLEERIKLLINKEY